MAPHVDVLDLHPRIHPGAIASRVRVPGVVPGQGIDAGQIRILGELDDPALDARVGVPVLGGDDGQRRPRVAAEVLHGRRVADGVQLLVVPGSHAVRLQAQAEGLDEVFTAAGGDWRLAGCSMCLGMNPDQLAPGQRCASTSNRNFEGRQGARGRTHLVSPAVAAATAVRGRLAAPADLDGPDDDLPGTQSTIPTRQQVGA